MTARYWLLAALGGMLLMAPTPGAVGSCGGDNLSAPADFAHYCQQREQLSCVRRYLRKEITSAERDACRWNGVDACKQRAFPTDCHPTERQAQTCLNALASFDTLQTKEDKLPECTTQALCDLPSSAANLEPDAGVGP